VRVLFYITDLTPACRNPAGRQPSPKSGEGN
jgi:hypothetical protein